MINFRWTEKEQELLYEENIKRTKLYKLEKIIGRSVGGILSKLRRLTPLNRRWVPVLKYYYHQFYEQNREAFLIKNRGYYRRHKKERKRWYLEHREEKKKQFREYYKRVSKKKPYRILDEIKGLESRVN